MHLLLAMRTGIFAEGRFLGRILDEWAVDSQEFLRTKLPHLVVVAVIALVLVWLLRVITSHMMSLAGFRSQGAMHRAQIKTLAGVIRTTGLAVIFTITGLQFLAALGLNLAPLLASAGIAGIAIGLAAQNIVKDMLNGVLILLEDQFNVGDTVRMAGLTGTVEAMTLRKTSVRDGDGTLYVIPNSQITTVANMSIGFSVATVNVSVDYSASPDEVIKLLKSIAMEIRNSQEYHSIFMADPQVLGVDAIKGSEMIIPVIFKTLATQQYDAVREFRRRVRLALEANHMLPGDPNRVFNVARSESANTPKRPAEATAPQQDATLLKPQESNPFTGE